MSFEMWVPFAPKVKQRPRMTRRGRAYTPQATIEHEQAIAAAYTEAGGPKFPTGTPVFMRVTFTPDGSQLVIGEASSYPRGLRGDIDNYMKATMDGLNGTAYDDDRQVVDLHALKQPRGWEPD